MKQEIIDNIKNPEILEKLYRENKREFTHCFKEIEQDSNSVLNKFWKLRLANETENNEVKEFKQSDLLVVIAISLLTGILAKLPSIFSQIHPESFYIRDLAIIVLNGIILYTFWHNRFFDKKRLLIYGISIAILLLYVNLLPYWKSDSINLTFIHVPLFLWCLFGLAYISFDFKNINKRIEFIRMNAELLIMTGLILIAGGLLAAITIRLFSVINMNIEKFYIENIAIFGGVAAPIVSFYLIKIYPSLTSKVAPVVARVFTPLVLITLLVYLISLVFSESKILQDRELLIIFNIMLVTIMAIIVFSITELNKGRKRNVNVLILFILAGLAIIINSIALIAIITRVSYGFTPNRTVVLFSNILIFWNLILITKDLYKSYFQSTEINSVEKTVAKYLTVYFFWTIIVISILPVVFGFK